MDTPNLIDPNATLERTISQLKRRCDEIERILARREQYLDMIDWGAMTEVDYDRAHCFLPDDLGRDLWEIDSEIDWLIESQWQWQWSKD